MYQGGGFFSLDHLTSLCDQILKAGFRTDLHFTVSSYFFLGIGEKQIK